jgi:hypothetical protein
MSTTVEFLDDIWACETWSRGEYVVPLWYVAGTRQEHLAHTDTGSYEKHDMCAQYIEGK